MRLSEILSGKPKEQIKYKVLTVEDVDKAVKTKAVNELLKLQDNIITIDFNRTVSVTDPNTAQMCVEVLTSDGNTGTLSHLTTNADPEKFVDALIAHHGRATPALLVGGDAQFKSLIDNLRTALTSKGFRLPDENPELGGNLTYRQSTLFRDKVVVRTSSYAGQERQVELRFPLEQVQPPI